MKDELDDIIVFLQKLGAKTIYIKGVEQIKIKSGVQSLIKTAFGVSTGERSGEISNSSTTSDSTFNKLSRMYSKEIKSELVHMPEIDNILLSKWGPIRKEWNAISQMREHGILEYNLEITCSSISSNKNIQVDKIEAEYRQLCVKTSASVNRETIKSFREEAHLGFNIHVEFYPISEYERFKSPNDKNPSLLRKLLKI